MRQSEEKRSPRRRLTGQSEVSVAPTGWGVRGRVLADHWWPAAGGRGRRSCVDWSTRRRGGSLAPIGPRSGPGVATGRERCQPCWRGGAGLPWGSGRAAGGGRRAAGGGRRASAQAASCPPRWPRAATPRSWCAPPAACAWCLSTAPTAAPSAWRSRRGSRTRR